MDKLITTNSEAETIAFGQKLAGVLSAGDIIYLSGELGSGKTQITKGIGQGLGVDQGEVTSPAFGLIHEYLPRQSEVETGRKVLPLYHMDFYRMDTLPKEEHGWIREYGEKGGVCAIEWAENIPEGIFAEYLEVRFAPYEPGDTREIELIAKGKRYEELVSKLS